MENLQWRTEEYHATNSVTMQDFLDNQIEEHCGSDYKEVWVDETQCEITNGKLSYIVDVYGDGDSFNHIAEFTPVLESAEKQERKKCSYA